MLKEHDKNCLLLEIVFVRSLWRSENNIVWIDCKSVLDTDPVTPAVCGRMPILPSRISYLCTSVKRDNQ